MLRATNEGSTSCGGWRPGFASSPALQALSSKETSSFLAHAPKKIIIPAADLVVLGVIRRLSMRDNRVYGGMTVASESQEPRVSSSETENEEEYSGSQDMNMDRMKARSADGSPETDIDLNEYEAGLGLAPEGRVHGGSLIMAMLAGREGGSGSGSSNLSKRWM
ncbi:BnaA09g11390D [Brassica napus]|uniref:BnaA09g11390D protein n=1 Tax=Brassica napus TaxID=3708 RepID=A0A078H9Q7_BRANA|nr:BnaA09g11390D [Brassica napus]